jgi:hypothetical protein
LYLDQDNQIFGNQAAVAPYGNCRPSALRPYLSISLPLSNIDMKLNVDKLGKFSAVPLVYWLIL